MRNLVFVAVLLLGFCAVSVAQDVPQFEVFGGWNIALHEDSSPLDYMNGWDASFAINANSIASAVIDVSGFYSGVDGAPSIHSFMVGPQVKIPQKNEKIVPFVRALIGVGLVRFEDKIENDNGLAMAFGGGLDFLYNERITIRPALIEFMTGRFDGEFLNTVRFGAGIVINVGEL